MITSQIKNWVATVFASAVLLYTGQGLVVGVAVGQGSDLWRILPLREGGPGIGAFILSVAGTNRRRWVDAVGCFTIQGHGVIAPDAFALALGILHGDITAKIPNSSLLHRALRQRGNARLFLLGPLPTVPSPEVPGDWRQGYVRALPTAGKTRHHAVRIHFNFISIVLP